MLPHVVVGNPKGKELVFIAGFPDDELSSFAPLIALLQDYRIIAICLPNYQSQVTTYKRWGYDFPQLVEMLDRTLALATAGEGPHTLVTHDWGAALGYLYEAKHPKKVKKMVSVDIGGSVPLCFHLVFYQACFALAYAVSQVFGIICGSIVFQFVSWLLKAAPFLSPLCSKTDIYHMDKLTKPTVHMTYPYFYVWKAILTGNKRSLITPFPACPLLFMVRSTNIMYYITSLPKSNTSSSFSSFPLQIFFSSSSFLSS